MSTSRRSCLDSSYVVVPAVTARDGALESPKGVRSRRRSFVKSSRIVFCEENFGSFSRPQHTDWACTRGPLASNTKTQYVNF